MIYQRARILVNWKFLGGAENAMHISYSWGIVTEASMNILQLHHEMTEETKAVNAFQPTSLIESCFINNEYFLAASVACFNLQHRHHALSPQEVLRTRDLLAKSLQVWNFTSNLSEEAIRLVEAARVVLGYPQQGRWDGSEAARTSTQQTQGQKPTRNPWGKCLSGLTVLSPR